MTRTCPSYAFRRGQCCCIRGRAEIKANPEPTDTKTKRRGLLRGAGKHPHPGWINTIERVVPDVGVLVEVAFIPNRVSLQELSVLTRFSVGVGKIPISAKSIARDSAP